MAELGRTYIKDALNRAIEGNEGAKLIGATIAGTTVSTVQAGLDALKALVDTKLPSNHTSVTNTRTPTDGTVTNAKVATTAAIAESKLSLASDAAATTASRRTLGPGAQQAAPGNDGRLSDTRTPTDGTVTDAKVAAGAAIQEAKLSLASDAAPGTASRRTLGPGAQQAAPGNDGRLSDTRTPTDGTVTDVKVSSGAAIQESKLALASDAAPSTASRRTLGTGAQQAAAGNDSRLHTRAHTLLGASDHSDTDASVRTPAEGDTLLRSGGKWVAAVPTGGGGGGLPTGAMTPFAGAAAPTGYLLCLGQEVSRTDYAALYTALGAASSPWGQGDGAATFNVPDMRGRAPIGVGAGTGLTDRALGAKAGAETHLLLSGESGMPSHAHFFTAADTQTSNRSGGGSGSTTADSRRGTESAGPWNASTAHNNMQPSVALNFIIKS